MAEMENLYDQGHLFVAALRLLSYRHRRPPSVKEICELLGIAPELGHYLCNRLARMGVVEVVEAAFEGRVYLRDHLRLEELPKEEKASSLERELQQLKEQMELKHKELERIVESHESKKKDLFSDLERQLREGLKKKKNPLDDL
jgi:hypothetical protein